MAASDNGASDGERSNAQAALAAHCARYGITPESLGESSRRLRTIICKSPFKYQKPKKDLDLARLCVQIFRYVVGDSSREVRSSYTEIDLPCRGLKIKLVKVYQVSAPVTDLEYEDWKECFEHYAPDFIETMDELRAAASRAAAARKHGFPGFIHKHDLFPPDAKEGKRRKASAGLIAALLAAKGSSWEKRQKLQPGNLLA